MTDQFQGVAFWVFEEHCPGIHRRKIGIRNVYVQFLEPLCVLVEALWRNLECQVIQCRLSDVVTNKPCFRMDVTLIVNKG